MHRVAQIKAEGPGVSPGTGEMARFGSTGEGVSGVTFRKGDLAMLPKSLQICPGCV